MGLWQWQFLSINLWFKFIICWIDRYLKSFDCDAFRWKQTNNNVSSRRNIKSLCNAWRNRTRDNIPTTILAKNRIYVALRNGHILFTVLHIQLVTRTFALGSRSEAALVWYHAFGEVAHARTYTALRWSTCIWRSVNKMLFFVIFQASYYVLDVCVHLLDGRQSKWSSVKKSCSLCDSVVFAACRSVVRFCNFYLFISRLAAIQYDYVTISICCFHQRHSCVVHAWISSMHISTHTERDRATQRTAHKESRAHFTNVRQ